MGFIMDGTSGEHFERKYTTKEIIRRFHSVLAGKSNKMTASVFFLVFCTVLEIIIPVITSDGIDIVVEFTRPI